MATYNYNPLFAAPSDSDLSASAFHAVLLNSSGQLALAGAGTGIALLQDGGSASGDTVTAQLWGIGKGILGGTVATGAWVKSDANGKLVTASAGDAVVGICMNGGAADTIQPIHINPAIASA